MTHTHSSTERRADGQPQTSVPPAAPSRAELLVWLDGALVPRSQAKVSVYDHGVLYGDGCFEGIRAYGGRIFKLGAHLRRLWSSAEKIRLRLAHSQEELAEAIRATMAANGLVDAYIRLVVTRGAGTLGLHPFRCPVPGTFIIADSIQLYPEELYRDGMKVIVARRPRIPVACLDPSIKSLNYLNNVLAKIEAIDAGVLEAIMLNVDGHVAECTGDNIFIVKDGRVATPSPESGLLLGITRQFVMDDLCPTLGIPVEERLIRLEEVLGADEVFLTGTAAEIIGVSQVDERMIGSGRVGPITARLERLFRERVAKEAPED
ncbi:MAG TPA: branched-chain-amino-acid transaminase [Phycisphaerales bacterium]|nr:branched-chain-amino-acid transaminase [Phycisphaerales bacterium]HMP37668.1 branched-chain-amino-acid transaminase [Phycisphaerales bacterium]